MICAHKIIRHWRTNDFYWKRSMASHSRRLAQNHVAAPLRWEENESSYGPSGRKYYRDEKIVILTKMTILKKKPIMPGYITSHRSYLNENTKFKMWKLIIHGYKKM